MTLRCSWRRVRHLHVLCKFIFEFGCLSCSSPCTLVFHGHRDSKEQYIVVSVVLDLSVPSGFGDEDQEELDAAN